MKLIADDLKIEINRHIESVKAHLVREDIGAALVSTNANIFYTSGRVFRGYVYIPVNGNAIWFVVRPDIFDKEEDVEVVRKPEDIPGVLAHRDVPVPTSLGLELDAATYSDVLRLSKLFPDAVLKNASPSLRRARMVKTEWELGEMKNDGVHQAAVYRRVTRCYKEDMTDIQLQIEIERVLRLEGCLGFVRTAGSLMDINLGSVIAGANADNPSPFDFAMGGAGVDPSLPCGADGTTIKRGQTVMVDMNGSFNGYQTDMTRVWSLGDLPALALRAHECSRKILRECESIGKPGVKASYLYEKAIEIAAREGLSDYFMGHRQKAAFIGHGVGIELNELPVITPRSKDVLSSNMTIALEPKFVIPGVGAVGVENTYVVTTEGMKSLTVFPEEIQEL